MKLERNLERTQDLIDRLRQYNDEKDARRKAEGTHVGDLVLCVRQSVYKILKPKEHSLETLGYFVDGANRDKALKELFKTKAEPVTWNGLIGSPDAISDEGDPIEFKTTRSNVGLSSHYGRQLAFYMIMMGKYHGILVVQRVNRDHKNPDWQPFESYDVELNEEDISLLKDELLFRKESYEAAISRNDPAIAWNVKKNSNLNWLCQNCLYREECFSIAE